MNAEFGPTADGCDPWRCTDRAGGEHAPTCDTGPAEVWCERCPAPSERTVTSSSGDHALCEKHAADLEYRLHSTAWNTSAGR